MNGVDRLVQRTFKLIEALFGNVAPFPMQPTFDELSDYTVALVNGEDVATCFPAVHTYVQQMGDQDAHYQALLALLRLERAGQLEVPPVPPQFDFSYLSAPPTSSSTGSPTGKQPWRIDLGRLLIDLTEQALAAFTPAATPQLGFRKSAGEQTIFALAFTEIGSGVNVNIDAHSATAQPDRVTVQVGITLPDRRWPHLKGIPITLTCVDASPITLATDPFGKTAFLGMSPAGLRNATIAIGPLAYWADV